MTTFLRNWLSGAPDQASAPSLPNPEIKTVSPQASDDEDDEDDNATETERDKDSDLPPAFPALNSAQRLGSSLAKPVSDAQLMPPPNLVVQQPGVPSGSSLSVMATTQAPVKPSKKRDKVALAPGHSPLDWARLKSSGEDLRGVDTLTRIPPSVLKLHNKRDDAWSAFNGKVYNITPYLAFHPGGVRELMRVAGRDGTSLFVSTHAWVNVDFMLDACMVGFLVPEPSSQ